MMVPFKIIISLSPVLLFLLALIWLDSFKLTRWPLVLGLFFWGLCAAAGSFVINSELFHWLSVSNAMFTRYISPLVEETLKALIFIYLFSKHKIGFLVDAAILGFAVGAGFAMLENWYYLSLVHNNNLLLWTIRGLGTAIMHGGSTAFFAVITKALSDRRPHISFPAFFPGLLLAVAVHSFFNHFIFSPVTQTLLQLIVLPIIFILVYLRSEHLLREWLEIGLDVDVWLLEQIQAGRFADTKYGRYLMTLKDQFPESVVVDMFCYLRLHLELAVRAKGVLLMREAGFPVERDQEIKEKLTEMHSLRRQIGKTGQMALAPLLQSTAQELWQVYRIST